MKKPVLLLAIAFSVLAAGILIFLLLSQKKEGTIRNVVLISLDTCRADHLSCYGFEAEITPHIDRLAREGMLFENAFTPVPLTLPAHSSMLTGTIPPQHGVHRNIGYKLGESNLTLAEILAENGYKTAAVVSTIVLESKLGLSQGFEDYLGQFTPAFVDDPHAEQKGTETTVQAIQWLETNADHPFFLFLHYYDPHDPYIPPEPFASRFAGQPYAGEIAFTDHCVGQVLDKLKELGLYDSTLILIVGDHGEMLGEHGENTHGYFIYQSAIRVPFIIRSPRGPGNCRIEASVSLIDIVPTILSQLDIELSQPLPGQDLSEHLTLNSEALSRKRHLYCESMLPVEFACNPLLAVIDWPWKYIYTTQEELYNCQQDPDEKNNMAEDEPLTCRKLRNRLQYILDENLRTESEDSAISPDQTSLDALHSLGYVGDGAEASFELDTNKPDPKDSIVFYEQARILFRLKSEEKYEAAQKLCSRLIREQPEVATFHNLAGDIAVGMNRDSDAVHHYRNYLKLNPDDIRSRTRLGTILARLGQITQAIEQWKKVVERDPGYQMAHDNLGLAYYKQGNLNLAVNHWEQVIQIEPGDADALNSVAWIRATTTIETLRDSKKSIQFARRACELTKNNNAGYLDTLSCAYASDGQFQSALQTAQKAMVLAVQSGNRTLQKQLTEKIQLFKQNKSYIEIP